MTRIDHVNEACALAIQADAFTSSDMVLQTGEVKADVIAAAQLHATLALVEQQRIANLQGLVSLTEAGQEAPAAASRALFMRIDAARVVLRPDIAAVLGIEVA